MPYFAVVFFVIALVAAVLGVGGIAAGAAGIAKVLFLVFVVLAVVTFAVGLLKRSWRLRPSPPAARGDDNIGEPDAIRR